MTTFFQGHPYPTTFTAKGWAEYARKITAWIPLLEGEKR